MSAPVRVQLRRSKGWKLPPNTIVVARPHRWGNPWKVGDDRYDESVGFRPVRDAADAVAAFRQNVDWHPGSCQGYGPEHRNRETIRNELRGKNLACWCALDAPCHADVLLEIANSPDEKRSDFGFGFVVYEDESEAA